MDRLKLALDELVEAHGKMKEGTLQRIFADPDAFEGLECLEAS